jgi:general secretion pathway protein D
VTTISGRQAHIEVTDLATIVTGSGANQTAAGGGGVGVGAGGGAGAVATTIVPTTSQIPLGPVLDVMPTVSADGFSIQMAILPTITEFLGYDDPGPFIIQAQSVGGVGGASTPLTAILPLPRLRVRQVVTTAVVWDGQTVALGGLIAETVQKVKDKVPVLGDMWLVGRLFRSESSNVTKKNLVIFVTPTIIDPSGNPLHTDEEMPFRNFGIPPQVPVKPITPTSP